jgi:hypothetical protein
MRIVFHPEFPRTRIMEKRREFIKSITALGVLGFSVVPAVNSSGQTLPVATGKIDDRSYWLAVMEKIATPVLENLARHELKKNMPVEAANPVERARYTHLEAFGRLLAGIAPWLAVQGLDEAETNRRHQFLEWAQASLDAATNPGSPDFMNFHNGGQALVDTAFLAQGILRAPVALWDALDGRLRRHIVEALKESRAIATPTGNNWVLFAATIEAALGMMGEPTVEVRLEGCLRRMLGWYKGDGVYGDGDFFHNDYYNSFVIHPMLVDVLSALQRKDGQFGPVFQTVLSRARRYAEIQERFIAPDGTFPSMGRSTAYRFGAFQSLAQIALLRELPEHIKPPQVRSAMTAVIRRIIEAPGTFDDRGWLQIGFCGHQASLAESYISTGSLYLCTAGLLPLGLPPADAFWSEPAAPWTSQQIWSGKSLPADHAMTEVLKVEIPTLHRP